MARALRVWFVPCIAAALLTLFVAVPQAKAQVDNGCSGFLNCISMPCSNYYAGCSGYYDTYIPFGTGLVA